MGNSTSPTPRPAGALLEDTDPVLAKYFSKHGDVLYPILKKHLQQHQEDPDSSQSRWEREMEACFLMKGISKRSIVDSYRDGLAPQAYRLLCQHQKALDQERDRARYVAGLRTVPARLVPRVTSNGAVAAPRRAVAAPKRAGQAVQSQTAPRVNHPARKGERISQRDRRPRKHFDEIAASPSPKSLSPRARSGPVRPTGVATRRPRIDRAALLAPPEQPSPAVIASIEDVDSSIEGQSLMPATPQDSIVPPPTLRVGGGRDDGPNCTSAINKFGWRLFRYFRHLERGLSVQEILNQDIFAVGREITNGTNTAVHQPLAAAEQQHLAAVNYNNPSQINKYLVGKYQTATAMAIYCEHNHRVIARAQAAGETKAPTLNWRPATIQLFYNADVNRFTTFFKHWEANNIFPAMFSDAKQQLIEPTMTARVSAAVRKAVYDAYIAWEDGDEVSNAVGNDKVLIRQ